MCFDSDKTRLCNFAQVPYKPHKLVKNQLPVLAFVLDQKSELVTYVRGIVSSVVLEVAMDCNLASISA